MLLKHFIELSGSDLKNTRKLKGMTQQGVADKLGVCKQSVNNWEAGTINLENKYKLVCLYGLE